MRKNFVNLMEKDIYFQNKISKLQVFFSKEKDPKKIPKIVWETNDELVEDPIEMKTIKVKKVLNVPPEKPDTFYIVREEIMNVLRRGDLITPMIYKETKDSVYCKGFKRWIA